MYPNISKRKQTSSIYPDLTHLKENVSVPDHTSQNEFLPTNSSFATQSVLQNHPEIQNKQKTDPVKENTEETTSRFWYLCKYIITILSSILFLLIKYLYSTFQYQESVQALPLYLKEVEKLKPIYSPQTDDFWNNIKSFPYSLLSEENPEGPAVLLMVAPAGGLNLSLQLTHQLAHILHKLLNSSSKNLHVNGTSLTVESPDDQKMMIDKQIRNLVDNQGQKVVVVVNLEKIDPNAIMIFHAYCDNSEAVYKNIAIIFLLELPSGVYAKNNGNVYSYLSQIWSRLGKSRYQALFSRMANNIAILKAK